METTVTLSKPITSHHGTLDKITVKEPTARQFIRHGEPFKVRVLPEGTVDFEFFNKSMMGFLSDLTGLDEIVLEDLAAKDFVKLRNTVADLAIGFAGTENPSEP